MLIAGKFWMLIDNLVGINACNSLLYKHPQIAEAMFKHLAGQVRRLTERVYEFSSLTRDNRIHAELLRLAENYMISPNEAFISPVIRSDIANLVSTTNESVSLRTLSSRRTQYN